MEARGRAVAEVKPCGAGEEWMEVQIHVSVLARSAAPASGLPTFADGFRLQLNGCVASESLVEKQL